jgi:hypothetical protein
MSKLDTPEEDTGIIFVSNALVIKEIHQESIIELKDKSNIFLEG